MDTKGGKLRWGGDGGVLNWAIGIDIYTIFICQLYLSKAGRKKKENDKCNACLHAPCRELWTHTHDRRKTE